MIKVNQGVLIWAGAALAVALVMLAAVSSDSASAGGNTSLIAVDTDIAGNAPTTVGSIETCAELANVGDTIMVDIVARGVPTPGAGGFGGSLLFNPAVLTVTATDVQFIDFADNPHPSLDGTTLVPFSDAVPDTDGDFVFNEAVFGGSSPKPTGDGVLMRVTLEAVGSGFSNLSLDDTVDDGEPNVFSPSGDQFPTTSVGDATIAVGDSCDNAPTPSPTPEPGSQQFMGDTDCDGGITTRDNQALLRKVLQQNALSQTEPCPDPGAAVDGDGNLGVWGDWDCDGGVTTRDNQALLRYVLQQNALSQTEPCPDIGAQTQV